MVCRGACRGLWRVRCEYDYVVSARVYVERVADVAGL